MAQLPYRVVDSWRGGRWSLPCYDSGLGRISGRRKRRFKEIWRLDPRKVVRNTKMMGESNDIPRCVAELQSLVWNKCWIAYEAGHGLRADTARTMQI